MRNLLVLALTIIVSHTHAQDHTGKKLVERKGFIFGVGLGGGVLSLTTQDTTQSTFATTLPNIKFGYMLNKNIALLALLPGANYKHNGKDRGFEGITIVGQYWLKNNWWVLGGGGLTFDAPAFYTVKDPNTAEFYNGIPALTMATGCEVWHKGRFALDLQYRLFLGKSNLTKISQRKGVSNMFIVGFNWY